MTYHRLNPDTVTRVKGDAESSFRSGDVNLTPANIGAAASGHTHSYLPLSGGTLTGSLNIKSSNIDRDGSNPSSNTYGIRYFAVDKDGEAIGYTEVLRYTDGKQCFGLVAANEKTDGTAVYNVIYAIVARDGTQTYAVSNPANFRSAIGAAASSHSHSYLPLSGGTVTGNTNINATFGVGTNQTYRFYMGGGSSYVWMDCRNSSGSVLSNIVMRNGYVELGNNTNIGGRYVVKTATNTDRINWIARASDYLHVETSNYGNKGVSWWSSDIRLKDNITDSEVDALGLVNAIPHRSFDMKRDGAHHDIGYIAQELEELDEKLVMKVYQTREVNGTSYFTGDYSYQIDERRVIPYLSRAIQQLSDENDELRRKNAELESRLERIEKELGL